MSYDLNLLTSLLPRFEMPWRMNRSILSFFLNFIFFVAAHFWYRYGYSYRYRWLSHLPPGCHVVTILKFRKSVVSDWWYLHYLYWHASYIITHNPPPWLFCDCNNHRLRPAWFRTIVDFMRICYLSCQPLSILFDWLASYESISVFPLIWLEF